MGSVVVQLSVSLDGRFEGPDGDISWGLVDDEVHAHVNEVLGRMHAFVSGRRNWAMMDEFWPTADEDPEAPGPVRDFAGIWREARQIVVSRTLTELPPRATELWPEVTAERVRALTADGDVAIGGADLAASFFRLGLVDELRLLVMPVVLGEGRPLFPDGVRLEWEPVGTRTFGNGVVLLHHRRPS